ncbi:LysR family transcriptional regulator [Pseudonocardia nematodicida]|uniref:LysR family transcriptional regulator n=1 Tax=Pseudonocardia nematodicida TaxID=1206997 RepID=A0ABV1K4K7_9PSEU
MSAPAPAHVPDLGALALLVAVARTGGLQAAGRELGMTTQAATARIRTVEKLVGAPVLERDRRGRRAGRLTARGALLVDWAGPVLDAARDLDAAVAALREPGPGDDTVVVAPAPTAAEYLVPRWLVELRDGPGGEIVLLDADDPATAVRDGRAAVGVVETAEPTDGLHVATVATDELVALVAPGHPWAGGAGIDAAELAATPLVTRRAGTGARPAVDAVLAAVPGNGPAAPARELAANSAVLAAVRGGDGPAVLPRLAAAADLAAGTLVEVPVRGVDLTREIRAVWPEGTSPRGTARDLLRIATGGRIR